MLSHALASGELDSVLAALEVALQSYTESREFASTCPTCSLHLANMMLNYQYWKSERVRTSLVCSHRNPR